MTEDERNQELEKIEKEIITRLKDIERKTKKVIRKKYLKVDDIEEIYEMLESIIDFPLYNMRSLVNKK
jgi:predicted NUDIX family phosphoesterase